MGGRRIFFYDAERAECSKCRIIKPRADFAIDNHEKRGCQRHCFECVRKPDDEKARTAARLAAENEARFWAMVDSSGGPEACWPWTGARDAKGYGKNRQHRRAYALKHGPIPAGLFVLHSCDNPSCCNPKHLRTGTHQDNMDDMSKRGRSTRNLTEEVVKMIRAMADEGATDTEIANALNVNRGNVYTIRHRRTWRHVP